MSDAVTKSGAWFRIAPGAAMAADHDRASGALAALAVSVGSLLVVGAALFFQYVMLIQPCPLCLEQRKFHYVAVPLALVIAVAAFRRAPRRLVGAALALLALTLFAGAVLAAYHAGVEWKWWAGPADCSGPIASFGSAGSLLQQIEVTSVVRCDEVSWRLLGLSLAGYNAVLSLGLAAVSAYGAAAAWRRR